jgi:hypothetical protein
VGRGVDRSTGLRSDQTIRLTGPHSSRRYPAPLRRFHYFDAQKNLRLVFLTNNFQLQALTIAQLIAVTEKSMSTPSSSG